MLAGGIAATVLSGGAATPLMLGMITGGAGTLVSGGVSAIDTSLEYYEHSKEPDTFKGVNSAGDVLTSIGAMGFNYLKMSIKSEYARKIEEKLEYRDMQKKKNQSSSELSLKEIIFGVMAIIFIVVLVIVRL